MSSGVGGNLDAALFQQVAVSVIVPAIQKQRDSARATIQASYAKAYSEWPLPAAMDDVIYYHGLCDLNMGIAAAQKSVANQPANNNATTYANLKKGASFPLSTGTYEITDITPAGTVSATSTITYTFTPKGGTAQASKTANAADFLKLLTAPAQ